MSRPKDGFDDDSFEFSHYDALTTFSFPDMLKEHRLAVRPQLRMRDNDENKWIVSFLSYIGSGETFEEKTVEGSREVVDKKISDFVDSVSAELNIMELIYSYWSHTINNNISWTKLHGCDFYIVNFNEGFKQRYLTVFYFSIDNHLFKKIPDYAIYKAVRGVSQSKRNAVDECFNYARNNIFPEIYNKLFFFFYNRKIILKFLGNNFISDDEVDFLNTETSTLGLFSVAVTLHTINDLSAFRILCRKAVRHVCEILV